MARDLNPLRDEANLTLARAERSLSDCDWAMAVFCAAQAIEAAARYAHEAWGEGPIELARGGGNAHRARADWVEEVYQDMGTSAAASMIIDYNAVWEIVDASDSANPRAALHDRANLARQIINAANRRSEFSDALGRVGAGQIRARAKHLPEARERASYPTKRRGTWYASASMVSEQEARHRVADARRLLEKFELTKSE